MLVQYVSGVKSDTLSQNMEGRACISLSNICQKYDGNDPENRRCNNEQERCSHEKRLREPYPESQRSKSTEKAK